MSKVYGLWYEGHGWLTCSNGEIVHSPFLNVMQAYQIRERSGEIREIGADDKPADTDSKAVRPQSDKAIHGPDADK